MMSWILVASGGAIGALARYATGLAVQQQVNVALLPIATLVVNTLGSFIIGACYAWMSARTGDTESFRLFVMVGILGGFTTYSAFSLETLRLLEQGQPAQAIIYVLLTLVLAMIGVVAGAALFRIV